MTTDLLFKRAKALRLHGIIQHWPEVCALPWLKPMIEWEEESRLHRSLDRRLTLSKLGRFKSLAEFDWSWPKSCDRESIEDLMQLEFLSTATNIILCGPNGVGKTTIACNLAHQAVLRGQSVLFTPAGAMLRDLASQEGDSALRRRLKYYETPKLLIIDELGYHPHPSAYADLLFEVVAQRHQRKSTLITTNKPFSEWASIFPSSACVVSLIDRLIHHSEIIVIEAESFRLKEYREKEQIRVATRGKRQKSALSTKKTKTTEK